MNISNLTASDVHFLEFLTLSLHDIIIDIIAPYYGAIISMISCVSVLEIVIHKLCRYTTNIQFLSLSILQSDTKKKDKKRTFGE